LKFLEEAKVAGRRRHLDSGRLFYSLVEEGWVVSVLLKENLAPSYQFAEQMVYMPTRPLWQK